MILGYQVQDIQGNNWGGRASNMVLTEATAIRDIKEARKQQPTNGYGLIAILSNDIDEPVFEELFTATPDQYKVIVVSVSHLTQDDQDALEVLVNDTNCNMVMGRTTGWFVKLYEEVEYEIENNGFSDSLKSILSKAHKAGFRMVEFDSDGSCYFDLPVFD